MNRCSLDEDLPKESENITFSSKRKRHIIIERNAIPSVAAPV
jgi:hypothetical protein